MREHAVTTAVSTAVSAGRCARVATVLVLVLLGCGTSPGDEAPDLEGGAIATMVDGAAVSDGATVSDGAMVTDASVMSDGSAPRRRRADGSRRGSDIWTAPARISGLHRLGYLDSRIGSLGYLDRCAGDAGGGMRMG